MSERDGEQIILSETERLQAEADQLREALHSMVGDNFGWGDDTVDNWWKHHIRRVLGDTPDE
jgi:hypothetical protein